MLLESIAAGLATAYFAATFAFVGFAVRAYLQVRRELDGHAAALEMLKSIERRYWLDAPERPRGKRRGG